MPAKCILIGSGPAALMAADILSSHSIPVQVFERRSAPGWKLLVAGSSGLNISFDCPEENLHDFYFTRQSELRACFEKFNRKAWLEHLVTLGEEPYLGTSKRYFIRNFKASQLLQSWMERLQKQGVEFVFNEELVDFKNLESGKVEVIFASGRKEEGEMALLALGGASWENELPKWQGAFKRNNIAIEPFSPSNVGYHLAAPKDFFSEAQGKPIKGLILQTKRGAKQGEAMITKYGLEGTPVYTVGCIGDATIDLKPELPEQRLKEKLENHAGAMWNRIQQVGKLSEGALLLVKHLAPKGSLDSAKSAAALIKCFPITFTEPRPLSEAISSKGGVSWDELNSELELKKLPNIFCAGEMIDWDAPTGGFLLQACISTGAVAANSILKRMQK